MAKISSKFGEQQLVMVNSTCGLNQSETGKYFEWIIISSYWMRLSRIWGILQIKDGVIHRGQRPRWITLAEICRLLHILRKPNSIIALLFIQNISSFFKGVSPLRSLFFRSRSPNITQPCPQVYGQRFNNLQRAVLLMSFWRHRFNNFQRAALLTSFVQHLVNSSWLW